ncbi:glycosyltransferase family 4 protein [Crateriforma conspicua]|uniref:Alpha-D-kanosaminyltransferase n=1 Tax=Crateriforma conspicua TaxID=2527996 RepID=A0A5C5YAH9_9PLAN|nr:glycosyltransferase family 4 protein [Crateriforma conspicua]QDV64914.1 Glycosyl transferases group 1 [Crateriforma conspicua]TWT70312.1 Alpha-D-kanosaminyltransferase [Crateriforma conspicua]
MDTQDDRDRVDGDASSSGDMDTNPAIDRPSTEGPWVSNTLGDSVGQPLDVRVVFMTHYIPLYQVRVLQSIAASVREFHVLLSTPIEPNRDFQVDWSGLNVNVQKNFMLRRPWKHTSGFVDDLYVHFPTDTQAQLRRLRPDVVMSLELGARSVGAAQYCRRNPDAKLILCTYMSEHSEQGRGWMRRVLRRRLIRQADAVTYNGPSCLRYLRDRLLVPGPKLFPLPYAADDRVFAVDPPNSATSDGSRPLGKLLCIGQLSDRKGVIPLAEQLVAYCRQNPNRHIELTFAGDGPKRHELESMVTPDNLQFRLIGNVASTELRKTLAVHDAVISPTLADEWLLVVNEALHAGVPVIGSVYAQAVTTLVQDDVNGWRFDPLKDASIASAMDRYFDTNDVAWNAMRQAAFQSVRERTPHWAASGAIRAIHALKADPWRLPDPELRSRMTAKLAVSQP